jgi:NAD-dependent deacetylase
MLDASERAVAVTGAGISVSAGIASMEGMDLAATLQMMSETLLRAVPGRYYRGVWKGFLRGMYEAGPTPAHRALARLEADGKIRGVVTTNIDCLHTLAGSGNVAEIQGSFAKNTCLSCGAEADDPMLWADGSCPRCPVCGGSLSMQADFLLVVGTNGPYAGTYLDCLPSGVRVAQVNPKSTHFDGLAELNVRAAADEVLPALL